MFLSDFMKMSSQPERWTCMHNFSSSCFQGFLNCSIINYNSMISVMIDCFFSFTICHFSFDLSENTGNSRRFSSVGSVLSSKIRKEEQ